MLLLALLVANRILPMSQRDGLYTILSEKIVRLNEELIRLTREAESVQSVIEKASTVSTLYADMYSVCTGGSYVGFGIQVPWSPLPRKSRHLPSE